MMKYNANYKVEFKTEKVSFNNEHREVFYRIVPSELNIFQRIFCNPWQQIYHAFSYFTGYNWLYTPREYFTEIKPLLTFGDVCNYIEREYRQINSMEEKEKERHKRAVECGDEWED